MGIKIFLAENRDRNVDINFHDHYLGVVQFGVQVVQSLNDFFSPENVVHWKYIAEDEQVGEKIWQHTYTEFEDLIKTPKLDVGFYSVFRINGIWKIGNIDRRGFVSVNISPYARSRADIYLDVIPSIYEDINDIIYEQENRKEMIEKIVNSLKAIKVNRESEMLSLRRIIGDDDEFVLFIYSKDWAIAWRSAQERLEKESPSVKNVKPYYNWDKIYDLFKENKSVMRVLEDAERKYGVAEEAGSVLLIGSQRESLDDTFRDLSKQLEKFMEKLSGKEKIEQKINEIFGGQTSLYGD